MLVLARTVSGDARLSRIVLTTPDGWVDEIRVLAVRGRRVHLRTTLAGTVREFWMLQHERRTLVDGLVITLSEIRSGYKAIIGIEAPRSVNIVRAELIEPKDGFSVVPPP